MATEQEEKEQLLKEFKIEIKNIDNTPDRILIGIDQIVEFIANEIQFWDPVKNQDIVSQYYSNLGTLANYLRQVKTNISIANIQNILNDIKTHFNRLLSRQIPIYIFSFNSYAEFIKNTYLKNSLEGIAAHHYIIGKPLRLDSSTLSQDSFTGLIKAYQFKYSGELFPSRNDTEKDVFNNLYEELLQKKDSIIYEYDNFRTEQKQWKNNFIKDEEKARDERKKELTEFIDNKRNEFDTYLEEKKKELSDLEDLYQKKLQLEAPVEYWQKRAQKYEADGKSWLNWFIRSIAVTVVILTLILYFFPDVLTKSFFNGDAGAIRGIIILASILSFLVYLTKTFAKMTFSSYHLQRDAEEREQLTMVYLALEKNKNISEKERELVLQSLFSRSDYGLLTGDSSPTMPGLQGVLDKLKV